MGYALFPLVVVLIGFALTQGALQQVGVTAGAAAAEFQDALIDQDAERVQLFAGACLSSARAAPGAVSSNLPITSASPVSLPARATCTTTPDGAAGRYVYAAIPVGAGVAGAVLAAQDSSALWYRAGGNGIAVRALDGSSMQVPVGIPSGALVYVAHVAR
ncbi:hypothetical protein [Burkholderia cenocepacia]|uniref:hypothetical protein n=1 Tax=Burkholderia cenocepacia TaxID=95486 RepID=UPI0022302369|nr:hypothetical protein [Burkholderia cenocepacia]MCW3677827.1 hypothetical protein [Burkholderia cenocepacia]